MDEFFAHVFYGWYLFGAFCLTLGASRWMRETDDEGFFRFVRTFMLLLSMYCIAAGLYWGLTWWQPPSPLTDPAAQHLTARGAAQHLAGTRRGGWLVVVLPYWPWCLMLFGLYHFTLAVLTIVAERRSQKEPSMQVDREEPLS